MSPLDSWNTQYQEHQAAGDQDEARHIDAVSGAVVARFLDHQQRQHDADDRHRDVDEEKPAPGQLLGQEATDQRADGGPDQADRRPDADAGAALLGALKALLTIDSEVE